MKEEKPNKKYQCQLCESLFICPRAYAGHFKCHSKKIKIKKIEPKSRYIKQKKKKVKRENSHAQ